MTKTRRAGNAHVVPAKTPIVRTSRALMEHLRERLANEYHDTRPNPKQRDELLQDMNARGASMKSKHITRAICKYYQGLESCTEADEMDTSTKGKEDGNAICAAVTKKNKLSPLKSDPKTQTKSPVLPHSPSDWRGMQPDSALPCRMRVSPFPPSPLLKKLQLRVEPDDCNEVARQSRRYSNVMSVIAELNVK